VLIIDADERMKTDPETIERILSDSLIDAVGLRIINPCHQGNICFDSTRIFRNNRGYRYEGIVHEQLVGPKHITLSDIEILHVGYDKGEEAKGRRSNPIRYCIDEIASSLRSSQ